MSELVRIQPIDLLTVSKSFNAEIENLAEHRHGADRRRGLVDGRPWRAVSGLTPAPVASLSGGGHTVAMELREHRAEPVVPVYFLSDSTGISAETMGNALLIQFPDLLFDRTLIPFITTVDEARAVVATLDAAMDGPVTPLAFTTTAVDEIRQELLKSRCPIIDFFDMHMNRVESILGTPGMRVSAQLHGVGDIHRYNTRMQAVEYALEHDDGQSLRALDKADVILVAPSRCGKTPTTMYLALQHGVFVANYPLVDEDLTSADLPRPIKKLRERCFGIVSTPARLSQVRQERRPNSRYSSLEQCTWELRRAEAMFAAHRIPVINSSAKSVEEMSTVILQTMAAASRKLERTSP